jgi:GGDEF domain-containing protein
VTRGLAAGALRRIVEAVAAPITVEGASLGISVSVGGCLCAGDYQDERELLALADQAMYRVKRSGGDGFRLKTCVDAPLG